ncbi:MAG: putative esterase lipoprotein, partial [Verrucomicrobiaceae bacterium]|nr:putative esterase lipoprotein [Verrucomicrobiaceae bacterium]
MARTVPILCRRTIHLLTTVLTFGLCSCRPAVGTSTQEITVNGLCRTYTLFVPETVSNNRPMPVVLVFHGSGGTGLSMDRMSGFRDVARREGFILVLPDAFEHNWNDGRDVAGIASMAKNVNDVAFVDAVIDEIGRSFKLNDRLLYAAGFSNGGIFVHRLAAESRHRFAAIAPVSGGIAEPLASRFKPANPVSVLILHGSSDPMVPFKGGEVDKHDNGRIISTEATAKRWIEIDHLGSLKPLTGVLEDKDKRDG